MTWLDAIRHAIEVPSAPWGEWDPPPFGGDVVADTLSGVDELRTALGAVGVRSELSARFPTACELRLGVTLYPRYRPDVGLVIEHLRLSPSRAVILRPGHFVEFGAGRTVRDCLMEAASRGKYSPHRLARYDQQDLPLEGEGIPSAVQVSPRDWNPIVESLRTTDERPLQVVFSATASGPAPEWSAGRIDRATSARLGPIRLRDVQVTKSPASHDGLLALEVTGQAISAGPTCVVMERPTEVLPPRDTWLFRPATALSLLPRLRGGGSTS